MSSTNQTSRFRNLPPSIFSRIVDLLDKKVQTELAITCLQFFQALTRTSETLYPLKKRISIVDLYKVTNMVIENRHFEPEFVKHVLNYAPNLRVLHFKHRGKFQVEFMRMFLKVSNDKSLTYFVPEEEVDQFKLLIDFVGLHNVTVAKENSDPVVDVDIDTVVTPEEVNRRVAVIKRDMKRKFVYTGEEKVKFKTQLSHQLPLHCNQLFQTKNYMKIHMKDFQSKVLDKSDSMSLSEARKLVEEVGPTFVESVCILKAHRFLITSFSVFIHHPGRVDDCADKSKYAYQDAPIAFIQRKTSYGSSSYELVIRLGYVEILANSGFIRSTTMPDLIPFAGSALQSLPETITTSIETTSSTNVFKNSEQQGYESSNRIINQYYKQTSTLPWQYNSLRFSKDGFKSKVIGFPK